MKLKLPKLKQAGSDLGRARDLNGFLRHVDAGELPRRSLRKTDKLARRTRKRAVAELRKLLR